MMFFAKYMTDSELAKEGEEALKNLPSVNIIFPVKSGDELDGGPERAVVEEFSVVTDEAEFELVGYDDGCATVMKCRARADKVAIPESAGSFLVTAIGSHAFSTCYDLVEVTFPSSIAKISEYAFLNAGIGEFIAPASLEAIGNNAFYKCANLKHVQLNDGLSIIGDNAFRETALTSITVPKTVSSIGFDAFKCTGISYDGDNPGFALEEGNERLSYQRGCLYERNGASLRLVQALDCELEHYEGVDGLVVIGERAFWNRKNLVDVVLPEGVVEIEDGAFRGCARLKRVTFPETLKSIGHCAFWETSLEEISIPAALDNVGAAAFYTGTTIARNFERSIERVVVSPGNKLFSIVDDFLCAKRNDGTSIIILYLGTGPEVSIPLDVTIIGPYAFTNAKGIRRLVLHDRLEAVDVGGFDFGYAVPTVVYRSTSEGKRYTVRFPAGEASRRAQRQVFGRGTLELGFLYEMADQAIISTYDPYLRSRAIIDRLIDPVMLDDHTSREFKRRLLKAMPDLVVEFGRNGYLDGIDHLFDLDIISRDNIDETIEAASKCEEIAVLSRLIELRRTRFGTKMLDFEI